MEISEFQHRLGDYMNEVAMSNSESTKAFLFLEFIRSIFKEDTSGEINVNYPHNLYPDLEKSIKSDKVLLIRGRIDALLGNLIIEFENNLKGNKTEEAMTQLKKYCTILWNNKNVIDYLCIASDGFSFLIYRPRSVKTEGFTLDDITLEQIDKFDIREEKPTTLFKRLDRYILYKSLLLISLPSLLLPITSLRYVTIGPLS